MKLSKRSIAAAVLLAVFWAVAAHAEPTTQPIEDAIARLGDPDPAVRERATQVLRNAGAAARKALQEAAKGDDPEVAARAQELLRAVPIEQRNAKVEVEAEIPDVKIYRGATAEVKRQVIARLGTTPDGVRALTKLWGIETDQALRDLLFTELLKQWSSASATLVAEGSITTAELLLSAAVDQKQPESPRAYAAYWRSRGQVDDTIRRWASRGGKRPIDNWAEHVLAALYRAKGDARSALAHAAVSEDPQLVEETLLWAGDWARLASELHQGNGGNGANGAGSTLRDVMLMTGMDSLAGDEKAVDADVAKLNTLVNTEAEAHAAADTMLLVNRPEQASKTLLDAQQFSAVYELLNDRGRYDDAAALLVAHDTEMSGEAMALRAVAAKEYARLGLKKQCTDMLERLTRENADIKYPRVFAHMAEAERELGMTEKSWGHFGDAIEACGANNGVYWYVSRAFPTKDNGVDWLRVFDATFSQNRRHPHPPRELYNQIRVEYDGSMPIDDLKATIAAVDLSSAALDPYIKLAWEVANRMKKDGHEADAVKWVEETAAGANGCELYIDLGDWAAEKKDWPLAAERYAAAWRKDRTSGLAMYLQGWALERGGHAAEGRERMELAHLIPLGNEKRREEMITGLQSRLLEDAAIREADILIRTGHPLSSSGEIAMRTAAERADEHGEGAVANALWQRTLTSFLSGSYTFRFESAYLHMPDMVRRRHARALLATGDWESAQRDIKASMEMLPTDSSVAIDLVPDLDKLGKHAEADALFEKVFAMKSAICARYPDSAWHHNECAWLAAKCNRELDKALVHAKRAVELDPTNAADIDTLAEVYFHQGHFKEAVELEKKCVEMSQGLAIHRKQLERYEAGGK